MDILVSHIYDLVKAEYILTKLEICLLQAERSRHCRENQSNICIYIALIFPAISGYIYIYIYIYMIARNHIVFNTSEMILMKVD